MNHLSHFFLSSLFFISFNVVCAQPSSGHNQGMFFPIVFLAIGAGILSLAFFLLLCSKYCLYFSPPPLANLEPTAQTQLPPPSTSQNSGLSKSIIDSIPLLRFSSLKESKRGLECSVCLARFEEAEFLRQLPKCKHSFHPECLDRWLQNHSSCPLCRNQVDDPEDPTTLSRIRLMGEDRDGDTSSFRLVSQLRCISDLNEKACDRSRYLIPSGGRSISEITNLTRFAGLGGKIGVKDGGRGEDGGEERVRRLWLGIARRTVEEVVGKERNEQSVNTVNIV